MLNGTKPYGNILDFRQQQDAVDAAIALFSGEKSGEQAREIWLVEKAPVVIQKLETALQQLDGFMKSQGLDCTPSAVAFGCCRAPVLRVLPRDNRGWQMAVCGCKVLGERCLRGNCLPYGQTKIRSNIMANKLKVWFDVEADFLEVRFSDAAGYEKETNHDAVMERVDAEGQVIGFSIMGVSQFSKDEPLEADLVSA